MALPLQVDWNKVQSMYLKGMTPKHIGELLGIKADSVSARAFRYKWSKSRIDSSVMVKAHNDKVQEGNDDSPALSQQSQRTRKALGDVIARSAEKLAEVHLRSPQHAAIVNQDAESLVRNAKTVFGWSEGQSSPAVRIQIMDSTVVVSEDKPQPLPTIEVESKVELLPEPKPKP